MIKEVTMYTVVCDGCGKDVNADNDISCWNDTGYLNDIAYDAGWERLEGKHYCPECFEYDNDDDTIILKHKGEQK